MLCKLNLILFTIDEKIFVHKIVSTDETKTKFPFIEITTEFTDIKAALDLIVSRYIENTEKILFNYRLSDIYIDENINIYYYCILNYAPKLKNSYEVSINYYENLPNLNKIIFGLSQHTFNK